MIVCLDFDGVLHDTSTVPPGRRLGKPLEGARDACWDLHRAGHRLVVHTSRIQAQLDYNWLYDWLRYFDFPFITPLPFKPTADVYVDDKAWRFSSWEQFQIDTNIFAEDVVPEVPTWTK